MEVVRALWSAEMRRLGVPTNDWYTYEQASQALDSLSNAAGLVGVAARYAKFRIDNPDVASGPDVNAAAASSAASSAPFTPQAGEPRRSSSSSLRIPSPIAGASAEKRRSSSTSLRVATPFTVPLAPRDGAPPAPSSSPSLAQAVDLLPYLIPAMGEEKAKEALEQHARRLRLDPRALTPEQAGAVLDAMSQVEGFVGVAAAFVKVKVLLPKGR